MAEGASDGAPPLPWSVRVKLFFLETFGNLAMRSDGTVNRFLFDLVDRRERASASPDRHGVRSADVDVGGGVWVRVFWQHEEDVPPLLPVLVYFHGGGFTLLSAASAPYDVLCRRFCRELRAVVVSVNYRLAPEHRCPAAYEDGENVLRRLPDLASTTALRDLGVRAEVDLSRCFIAGDSAGGNIAHHVAQRWTSSSTTYRNSPVRLAGIILVQPYFGGEERTPAEQRLDGKVPVVSMCVSDLAWRAFLPEDADRNHPAAHVTKGNANLGEGFPRAMVVVGGLDPLQDRQRQYADVLRELKAEWGAAVKPPVEFRHAIHGFFFFPELPETDRLVTEMKAFMDEIDTTDQQ